MLIFNQTSPSFGAVGATTLSLIRADNVVDAPM
jgi:hypothetical protein